MSKLILLSNKWCHFGIICSATVILRFPFLFTEQILNYLRAIEMLHKSLCKVISVNNVQTNLLGAHLYLKGLLMGCFFPLHMCWFIIYSSPPGAVSNPTALPHITAHSSQLPQIPGWELSVCFSFYSLWYFSIYGFSVSS